MIALRDSLRRIVMDHMAQDPAHDLAHLDRVWRTAEQIALDDDSVALRVLMAACYLHDLVNLPKDAPNRAQASTLAAKQAAPILTDLGFCEPEIASACHAIAAHSYSAGIPPETPEARILRDADRLDALGAIGIARCFVVSGALNRPLYDPEDPFATARPLNDGQFALDHWPVKLLRLPDDMMTDTGRKIALTRRADMLRFARSLANDMGTTLPPDWTDPT
ncbi:HD domain-containing protein [Shimia sp.]|uniref:HD domain-containing protein n=1 Tax=Shimia sp. TaxID=1954381 RepID=UPI00329A29AD